MLQRFFLKKNPKEAVIEVFLTGFFGEPDFFSEKNQSIWIPGFFFWKCFFLHMFFFGEAFRRLESVTFPVSGIRTAKNTSRSLKRHHA